MTAAVISADGLYRYTLERQWCQDPRYVLWLMLNPSTADATKDDATIRRCVGFAKSWGYGGILVGNLYAYRATHPRELKSAADPVGPENDVHLLLLFRRASLVVCGWGVPGPHPGRLPHVLALLETEARARGDLVGGDHRLPVLHRLRVNRNYSPAHPLRMPSDLQPVLWPFWRRYRHA